MRGRCLTIAGSDSGGGAGIQADLKTFFALQVYGTTAVTALTAQNTLGVQATQGVHPDFVCFPKMLPLPRAGPPPAPLPIPLTTTAVCGGSRLPTLPPGTTKGMLHSAPVVEAVADVLTKAYTFRTGLQAADGRQPAVAPHVVLDPVMVSSSGDTLLSSDAVEPLRRRLLPLATVVTPNYFEALALAGKPADFPLGNDDALREVCEAIGAQGPRWVLLKGGQGGGETVRDVLWDASENRIDTVFCRPRCHTTSTHGAGCTLSAAICAFLARGCSVRDSCARATQFVARAISTAVLLVPGHGHIGPVNYAQAIKYLPLPTRSVDEPNPLEAYLINRNR
ncbi:MAG: phosphomethylpyrimidine kinase, partial [Olpidium bornovanus]